MLKKASAAMRNDYGTIATLVQENKRTHIIYITKNEEGDFVVMSINAFEKRERMDSRQSVCQRGSVP